MSKPNHKADIKNSNKGTAGTNITYDKAMGNKGKQLNTATAPPKVEVKKTL